MCSQEWLRMFKLPSLKINIGTMVNNGDDDDDDEDGSLH